MGGFAVLLEGACMLQALAAKGKQGGTEKELRELVQKREAACMETNTDTTITRLVGANKTVQQELNKVRLCTIPHVLYRGNALCLQVKSF